MHRLRVSGCLRAASQAPRKGGALAGVALALLAGCTDPPLNPPFWAGHSVGQLRQEFPVGQTRIADVKARVNAPDTSFSGPGFLDAKNVFYKRDSRTGRLNAEHTLDQPTPPLRPMQALVYVWFENNPPPPSTRTAHERHLRLYFDADQRLVYLDRFDREPTRRNFNRLF